MMDCVGIDWGLLLVAGWVGALCGAAAMALASTAGDRTGVRERADDTPEG